MIVNQRMCHVTHSHPLLSVSSLPRTDLGPSPHQLLGFESWVLRVSAEDVTPHPGTTDVETFVATVTVLPADSSDKAQAEGVKVSQRAITVTVFTRTLKGLSGWINESWPSGTH